MKDLGSFVVIIDVKNSEIDVIDSMLFRDIEVENRLMIVLRFFCKLFFGYFVKVFDVKGVVLIYLLRSLSLGVVTIVELVYKFVYLIDFDLLGNLFGF